MCERERERERERELSPDNNLIRWTLGFPFYSEKNEAREVTWLASVTKALSHSIRI